MSLRPRERGFALLIVLWGMVILALIGTHVTSAGRAETQETANLRANAIAEAAADGAVFLAIFHLLDGSDARWTPDGLHRQVRMPQAIIDITIDDERRKLTLNNSQPPLLRALLQALGVNPGFAAVLADEIADWRSPPGSPMPHGAKAPSYRAAGRAFGPPSQPFRSVDELRLVLDMPPEVAALLERYVSPYVESPPRMRGADPVIANTLAEASAAGAAPPGFDEPMTVTITAAAVGVDGARFVRRAVVRFNEANIDPDTPRFAVLEWEHDSD